MVNFHKVKIGQKFYCIVRNTLVVLFTVKEKTKGPSVKLCKGNIKPETKYAKSPFYAQARNLFHSQEEAELELILRKLQK